MNCAEFESVLQRCHDDGFVRDDDLMREHRQACAACQEAWEGARLLTDSIAVWREQLPEVDLADAVVFAQLQSVSSDPLAATIVATGSAVRDAEKSLAPAGTGAWRKQAAWLRNRRGLLATTSCLAALIAVWVLAPVGDVQRPVDAPPAVVRAETPVEPHAPNEEVALLSQAGAAYGTLTRSAVGALEEFALIVIPIRLTDQAPLRGDADGEHWIDGLQQQLQPLQQSLDDALDFLREVGETPTNSRT